MGSIAAMLQKDLRPEQANLLRAVMRARYTLRELSVMLGRNRSYLQQYITQGSPAVLSDDVRRRLAAILHIDEALLRGEEAELPAPPPLPIAATGPAPPAQDGAPADRAASHAPTRQAADLASLPLHSETPKGLSEPAPVQLTLPLDAAGTATLAIALTEAHGILQPRHLLLCDRQPVRVGDLAFVSSRDHAPAAGLVLPAKRGAVAILDGSEAQNLPAGDAAVYRILSIRTQ